MKTIRGIALMSAGVLLSACDSPVALVEDLSDGPGVVLPSGAPENPFAGFALHVDSWHPANATIASWREDRPEDAALLEGIVRTPQAVWLTGGSGDVSRVQTVAAEAASLGAVPVFVLYNIPARDCGGYSGDGGADAGSDYRRWISDIADGLAGRPSLVVLEPDALANMDCLSASDAEERVTLLGEAVRLLRNAAAAVYIDAGHPRWHSTGEMADRLVRAGVTDAHGFALNVSNFVGTAENIDYADELSTRLGGLGYVIDTSRNGAGAHPSGEWCNPTGRALGGAPTLAPELGNAHALLWLKRPGESDGPCNGGPAAGIWWPEYALDLARRAS